MQRGDEHRAGDRDAIGRGELAGLRGSRATSRMTIASKRPVDDRDVDLPAPPFRWCARSCRRGRKPSWIAWWVTEKAPEITAWLAMIVATVAMHDQRQPRPFRRHQDRRDSRPLRDCRAAARPGP